MVPYSPLLPSLETRKWSLQPKRPSSIKLRASAAVRQGKNATGKTLGKPPQLTTIEFHLPIESIVLAALLMIASVDIRLDLTGVASKAVPSKSPTLD